MPPSLTPVGKLGFRGRTATPEERARIFDALFFEGEQRIPYLQQYFALMLLSAAIAAFGLVNDSAAVVIGAMLVAPLMTPILAVAAAIVHGWGRRALESLLIVGGGALAGIGVGIAIGWLIPSLHTGLPLPVGVTFSSTNRGRNRRWGKLARPLSPRPLPSASWAVLYRSALAVDGSTGGSARQTSPHLYEP